MTPQKSFDGKIIQEGVYLDSFGQLVHVKANGNGFIYRDASSQGYITLGNYAQQLLGRVANARVAADFLSQLEPVESSLRNRETHSELARATGIFNERPDQGAAFS